MFSKYCLKINKSNDKKKKNQIGHQSDYLLFELIVIVIKGDVMFMKIDI